FETPLNPFKSTDGGTAKHDEQFTLDWMKKCRKEEPARCAFDNHDLDSTLNKDLDKTYEAMQLSGAEVEFQPGPALPKDLDDVMRLAVEKGATSVELYQDYGGFTQMPDAKLKKYTVMLTNNRADLK